MHGPLVHPDACRFILDAYRRGAFPMARPGPGGTPLAGAEAIDFYTADPRAIVPLEPGAIRWARSLRAAVRRADLQITADRDFEGVIRACAAARRPGRWINDWIIEHYIALHRMGHAHSVEAWTGGPGPRLVGGLYGVHIGGAFFGESKFSLPGKGGADASKVCFYHLVGHLQRRGFALLDSQFNNPHMRSLGAVDVPLEEYTRRLSAALDGRCTWGSFESS